MGKGGFGGENAYRLFNKKSRDKLYFVGKNDKMGYILFGFYTVTIIIRYKPN